MVSISPDPHCCLIVEDEEIVRMNAAELLSDAGFKVIEAANADQAWAILKEREDIGILFTDVHMPGSMDGFVLAQRVHACWPYIHLVITSGLLRPRQQDVPDHGRFLPKPYRQTQLLHALAEAGHPH